MRSERIQAIGTLVSVVIASVLALLTWRSSEVDAPLGLLLATVLVTHLALGVVLFLAIHRTIVSTAPSLARGQVVLFGPGGLNRHFASQVKKTDIVEFVCTSDIATDATELANAISSKCKTVIHAPPGCQLSKRLKASVVVSLLAQEPFLAFGVWESDGTSRLFLRDRATDSWALLPPDVDEGLRLRNVLSAVRKKSAATSELADFSWLREKQGSWHARTVAVAEKFSAGQFETLTPQDIYSEQLQLSENAASIEALDMTEISEWLEPHGMQGCLDRNIETVSAGGFVRRIIFAPSRSYLVEKADYARQVAEVCHLHVSNGLECGVIFMDELTDKSLIADTVLYSGSVLWVETTPTTRFAGTGYFTTSRAEIDSFRQRFEMLWSGNLCPNPRNEALSLVKKYRQGESGLSEETPATEDETAPS